MTSVKLWNPILFPVGIPYRKFAYFNAMRPVTQQEKIIYNKKIFNEIIKDLEIWNTQVKIQTAMTRDFKIAQTLFYPCIQFP